MGYPVETNQTGRESLDVVKAEARYRRERRDLYAARLYGGRPASLSRLQELTRESSSAHSRLVRALRQDYERNDKETT